MQFKELFYIANIIDYFRILSLCLAVTSTGTEFAKWYSISYILDAFDGYVARALNQESKLGYYLDMVIDRVSSIVCLHFAAQAILTKQTFLTDGTKIGHIVVPPTVGPLVAFAMYYCIVMVEVAAHGVVMILSEVQGLHQKKLGYEFEVVRLYLSDKRILFWACASFEGYGLGLILNIPLLVGLSLPGFLFRVVANMARLMSIVLQNDFMITASEKKVPTPVTEEEKPEEQPKDVGEEKKSSLGDHKDKDKKTEVVRRKGGEKEEKSEQKQKDSGTKEDSKSK